MESIPGSAMATHSSILVRRIPWTEEPGELQDMGSENGAPVQYSCLGNPMDRGTWWVAVCEAAKSQTQLNSEHTQEETAKD